MQDGGAMVGDPEPADGATANASLGARAAGSFRRGWATEKGRRRIVVSAGTVIAIVTIAIVVSLFASLAGESQSYRDGYSAGGTAYAAYQDSNITPEQACQDEAAVPGVRPVHDDAAQWIQGCVDGFNFAQSDN
jgi:predicted cobalt transporter CbtA